MGKQPVVENVTTEILEKRKKYFIPTAAMYYQEPLQLVSAQGCSVYDENGNEYLDCIGGIVCISAGHNHPKIKAHVSFTHGEGYGRPLLEASLSGKPVITSDWSGHKDFLNENAVLLPGEVKNVHPSAVNEWIIKESSWFTVNYSLAARNLNDVFENYSKYLAKSEKLAKENSEKFSLDRMQKELDSLLTKSLPVFPKKQQIVLPKLKKVELPVAV